MTQHSSTYGIRVFYEDTDVGGIVYHANYLKFFERARTEMLREFGVEQSLFLDENFGFVIKNAQLDYKATAKLDEKLTVHSRITQHKRVSLLFEQEIFNQQEVSICKANILVVGINLTSARPCAIPQAILGALNHVS